MIVNFISISQIDGDLVKPTMRAAIEEQLNLIAQGKANFEAVLQHTIDTFMAKFKYFVEHILSMDELFEVSFSPLASSGRPMSRFVMHIR
jgi:DNA topoisomerase III